MADYKENPIKGRLLTYILQPTYLNFCIASSVFNVFQSSTLRFQTVCWDFSLSISVDIRRTNKSPQARRLLNTVWFINYIEKDNVILSEYAYFIVINGNLKHINTFIVISELLSYQQLMEDLEYTSTFQVSDYSDLNHIHFNVLVKKIFLNSFFLKSKKKIIIKKQIK